MTGITITFKDGGTEKVVAAVKSVEKAVAKVEEKAKDAGTAMDSMAKLEKAEAIAAFGQGAVMAGGDLSDFLNVMKEVQEGQKGLASATVAGITAVESFAAAAVLANAAMGPWGIALVAGITALKAFAQQEEEATEKQKEAAQASKDEAAARNDAAAANRSLTESLKASTAAYAEQTDAADATAEAVRGITDAELALAEAQIAAEGGPESLQAEKRAQARIAALEKAAEAELEASRAREQAARENMQSTADRVAELPAGQKGVGMEKFNEAQQEYQNVVSRESARQKEIQDRLDIERDTERTIGGNESAKALVEEEAAAKDAQKKAAEEAAAAAAQQQQERERAADAALRLRDAVASGEGPSFRNAGAAKDFNQDLTRAANALRGGDESATPQLLQMLRQVVTAMERQKKDTSAIADEVAELRKRTAEL